MRVAIGTPAHDGRAGVSHSRSVIALQRALKQRGHEAVYIDASRGANLPRLRNTIAAMALHWGAERILWLDSDITIGADDGVKLIESGEAIIGAVPQARPKQHGDPPSVSFQPLPDGGVQYRSDGLVRIGKLPTACMCTGREVFEHMRDSGLAKRLANREGKNQPWAEWFRNYFWYELEETGETCPVTGEPLYMDDGEDWYLCRKVADTFDCLIDPKLRLVHHEGRLPLTVSFWDIYGHAMQQAELAA